MVFKYCLVSCYLLLLFTDTSFGRILQTRKCEQYQPKVPSYDIYNSNKISERKCVEYMYELNERQQIRIYNYVCSQTKKRLRRQLPQLQNRIDIGNKINNGSNVTTQPSEYPHMGALGWMTTGGSWVFLCGSSLISENFVLTSGHCTKIKNDSLINDHPQIVRLGVVNIYDSKAQSLVDGKIKEIIRHPMYDPPKKYYDIALIKLETTVTFTKFVHPACLSTTSVDLTNKNFTITGWGETENGTTSPNLLSATVDLFGSNCSQLPLNRNWWGPSDHQLCAGKLDGSVDTCRGDSGGPLQFKLLETEEEGTMHTIVGITTFGARRCPQTHTLGVYTQVSSFTEWIEEHVWPEETKIVFPNN